MSACIDLCIHVHFLRSSLIYPITHSIPVQVSSIFGSDRQIYIVIPVYARKCTWFNVWCTRNLNVEFCNFLAYAESIEKKNVVLFSMRYRLGQLILSRIFFFFIINLLIYIYIHCPIFITVTCYLLKIEINKNHVHYTCYKDVTWK